MKGISKANAAKLAQLIDKLVGSSGLDLIVCAVVDLILETSDRLDLDRPDEWLTAAKRGDGVNDLAAWFRKIPPTFSLRHAERARKRRPETVTAERLAALLEAPETPRVVRELIQVACESIGVAAVAEPEGGGEPVFEFPHPAEITPALIRRRLPKMLRKVGHWHLVDWMGKDLEGPAEEGGGES